MNKISFKILPSPESNDHQVIILIDGESLLDEGHVGIDPPEFFKQLKQNPSGKFLVGRCGCGVVGCDDVIISISRDKTTISWLTMNNQAFEFSNDLYDLAIKELMSDKSWESVERQVERLVGDIMLGTKTDDGFSFQWASARIQQNIVHMSFINGIEQRLLEFSWDGVTSNSAVKRASQFKRERFDN